MSKFEEILEFWDMHALNALAPLLTRILLLLYSVVSHS